MNPGRELDALIAEKIMGIPVYKEGDEAQTFIGGAGYDPCKHHVYKLLDGRVAGWFPCYSTDISAAWEVVERANLFLEINMCKHFTGRWLVTDISNEGVLGKSRSLPHAICLAALKAVGHEV